MEVTRNFLICKVINFSTYCYLVLETIYNLQSTFETSNQSFLDSIEPAQYPQAW